MATNPVTRLTAEEYLRIERAAEFKSEFIDGEMFLMAGASMNHCILQRNLAFELHAALRGSGCQYFGSDLRVRVTSRMYAYPDISIVCGDPQLADSNLDILVNPSVIIEITSPSTEGFDRGVKWSRYRTIVSLREYILLSQHTARVEQYTRQDSSTWLFRENHEGDLRLESIGVAIPLERIYEGVELRAESE